MIIGYWPPDTSYLIAHSLTSSLPDQLLCPISLKLVLKDICVISHHAYQIVLYRIVSVLLIFIVFSLSLFNVSVLQVIDTVDLSPG